MSDREQSDIASLLTAIEKRGDEEGYQSEIGDLLEIILLAWPRLEPAARREIISEFTEQHPYLLENKEK